MPFFTLDGHAVWCIDVFRNVAGWTIIKESESCHTRLEPLEPTMHPLGVFPWGSPCGYEVADDGVKFTAIYTLFQTFLSNNGYAIDDLSTSVNCPIMPYALMLPFAHDLYKSNTWKATIIKIPPIQQET